MRNVDVAAQNEVTFALDFHQVGMDLGQEPELGLLAFFARGTTRKVSADDRQLAGRCVKTQLHISAFCIELC